MTLIQVTALEYVRNTRGGATLLNFIEDHEPIGEWLWDDLDHADAVGIGEDGKIFLTDKGKSLLGE